MRSRSSEIVDKGLSVRQTEELVRSQKARGAVSGKKKSGTASDVPVEYQKLKTQLSDHFNVFVAYNRRINRPTIKMLNPYTNEYADILNMHVGNPDLKPEYVNSFETGTFFVFDKVSGWYCR